MVQAAIRMCTTEMSTIVLDRAALRYSHTIGLQLPILRCSTAHYRIAGSFEDKLRHAAGLLRPIGCCMGNLPGWVADVEIGALPVLHGRVPHQQVNNKETSVMYASTIVSMWLSAVVRPDSGVTIWQGV